MSNSLDRLFKLLESGSNDYICDIASKQIGIVFEDDNTIICYIIDQIKHLLFSNNWESRTSGGKVLGEVLSKLPVSWLSDINKVITKSNGYKFPNLVDFDIHQALQFKILSGGKNVENLVPDSSSSLSQLNHQKLNVQSHLGFSMAGQSIIDPLDTFICDEDLIDQFSNNVQNLNHLGALNTNIKLGSGDTKDINGKGDNFPLSPSISKEHQANSESPLIASADDCGGEGVKSIEIRNHQQQRNIDYVYQLINESLLLDLYLYNPKWEWRHGALIGIRHFLTAVLNDKNLDLLLSGVGYEVEDIIVRMLYMLVSDKFADYVGDEVVAPIRETAAQVLSLCVKIKFGTGQNQKLAASEGVSMSSNDQEILQIIISSLGTMITSGERLPWEIRLSGALGFKYVMPLLLDCQLDKDCTRDFLGRFLAYIKVGLNDTVDDVIAISSDVINSLSCQICEYFPHELGPLIDHVWANIHRVYDDEGLSVSARRALLELVARLLSRNPNHGIFALEHDKLNAKLRANSHDNFFLTLRSISDSSLAVRRSSLNLFSELLREVDFRSLYPELLIFFLKNIYLRVLVEESVDLYPILEKCWEYMLSRIAAQSDGSGRTAPTDGTSLLLTFFASNFDNMLCLAMHRADAMVDPLLNPSYRSQLDVEILGQAIVNNHMYIGGFESFANSPKDARDSKVNGARMAATKLLATLSLYLTRHIFGTPEIRQLYYELPKSLWFNFESLILYHLNCRSYIQRSTVIFFLQQFLMLCTKWNMENGQDKIIFTLSDTIHESLLAGISHNFYYDELSTTITEIQALATKIFGRLKVFLDSERSRNLYNSISFSPIPTELADVLSISLGGELGVNTDRLPNILHLNAAADWLSKIEIQNGDTLTTPNHLGKVDKTCKTYRKIVTEGVSSYFSKDPKRNDGTDSDVWEDSKLLKILLRDSQAQQRTFVTRVQASMSGCFGWLRALSFTLNPGDGSFYKSSNSRKSSFFLKPLLEGLKQQDALLFVASDLCLHFALAITNPSNVETAASTVEKVFNRLLFTHLPNRTSRKDTTHGTVSYALGLDSVESLNASLPGTDSYSPWRSVDEFSIPSVKNFLHRQILKPPESSPPDESGGPDRKRELVPFRSLVEPCIMTLHFIASGIFIPSKRLLLKLDGNTIDHLGTVYLTISSILHQTGTQPKPILLPSPPTNNTANSALVTLQLIVDSFGPSNIPKLFPSLWQTLSPLVLLKRWLEFDACVTTFEIDPDQSHVSSDELVETCQRLLCQSRALQFTLGHVISASDDGDLDATLDLLFRNLSTARVPFVRFSMAKILGHLLADEALNDATVRTVIESFILHVIPCVDSFDVVKKYGLAEGLIHLLSSISLVRHHLMLPYLNIFIIPILGLMTDSDSQIRGTGSHCFTLILPYLSLNNITSDIPQKMAKDAFVKKMYDRGQIFLRNFLKGRIESHFELPFELKNGITLREYQRDGIQWLLFLRDFKLHGLLCDDMGLGKTLQTICAIAYHCWDQTLQCEGDSTTTGSSNSHAYISLIVCPVSLTYHWYEEISRFIPGHIMHPQILNSPESYKSGLDGTKNIVYISSYETVRKNVDFYAEVGKNWQYLVLDEGHIIKNQRTKLTRAIKAIPSKHRLILSGTPIQNNVYELWSLFDFLMPGYLGSEKHFNNKYGKPISVSRDAKKQSKELESGIMALGNLHKQVLPFVLRRTKDQVLKDLPPKIIQDYACQLTWFQRDLYRDFMTIDEGNHFATDDTRPAPIHAFKVLSYQRKVCNHPALVLSPLHPQWDSLIARYIKWKLRKNEIDGDYIDANNHVDRDDIKGLKSQDIDRSFLLKDVTLSGKFMALIELLQECGIIPSQNLDDNPQDKITEQSPAGDKYTHTVAKSSASLNRHRALVFFQLIDTLKLCISILTDHFPTLKFMVLEGSTPVSARHQIVTRFNDQYSARDTFNGGDRIDLLFLTTRVGGLGLNLTGADTVIFFEHDWNPMKDLQAMDRAHRIGQKKVVNVYRLITKDTLEEKIMSLQRFKIGIANTVVSSENSDFSKVSTICGNMCDFFSFDDEEPTTHKSDKRPSKRIKFSTTPDSAFMKELESMLGNESQYETEFELTSFIASLNAPKQN